MIYTKNGIVVATGFERVVSSEMGTYMEFTKDQMVFSHIKIPQSTMWRKSKDWKDKVYYIEYRTQDGIMVYLQKRLVKYADYKIDYFYIAVNDLEEVK